MENREAACHLHKLVHADKTIVQRGCADAEQCEIASIDSSMDENNNNMNHKRIFLR